LICVRASGKCRQRLRAIDFFPLQTGYFYKKIRKLQNKKSTPTLPDARVNGVINK